jgi:fibronectin-binding autotransporter adhesin
MGVSIAGRGVTRFRRPAVRVLAAAVAAGALAARPPAVQAAAFAWADTTGAWSTPSLWGGTVPPTNDAATVLQFGTGVADYTSTFDLTSPFQLNGLTLAADPGRTNVITAPTLTNTLDFVASGTTAPLLNMTGGGTFRIANNVRVAPSANLTLNVAGGSNLVFSAAATPGGATQTIVPVSGAATTTIDGGGTVVWRSITTNIAVNSGLVTTDADGDFLGSAAVTMGANGVIDTGGFTEGWNTLAGVAGATFRGAVGVSGGGTGTFRYDGVITNRLAGGVAVPGFGTVGGTAASNGSIAKSGTHTFVVSGPSTYTGATTLTGGTLVYAGDPATVGNTTTKGFASGTIFNSPFGTGTVNLNGGGTLSIDAANRTIVNPITVALNTVNTLDVPTGGALTTTGLFTHNGTLNKTGLGTWQHGGTSAANIASVLNINAGTVLLNDITGGDMNTATINVNGGGTFQFGSNPQLGGSENPDHPGTTYFNVNTGGTVVWNVGESLGGVNLLGGSITMVGSIGIDGATASEFRSGTVTLTSGAPAINGAQAINKTTAGTVTIAGVPLNNTGGLNIQEGVLATSGSIASVSGTTPIAAPITFGTATTAGTLRYTGNGAAAPISRQVALNAGGGTIDVSDPAGVLTFSGTTGGDGPLTKAGPGTLVLSGSATVPGGTTIAAGTLQIGTGTAAGTLAGNVVNNGSLAFNRSGALTFAGNVSGTGSLTTLGTGTVDLTAAALTYTGPTTVSAGVLRIAPVTLAGAVAVGDTAGLTVVSPAGPAGTLTVPSLALGAAGTALRFEINQAGNPANPLLNVTSVDGLTLNGGTHTLVVANQGALAVGTFTLVDYAGAPITSGFSLATLPARTQGNLAYDAAATKVNLVVTGVDSIRWNGNVSSTWDAGADVNAGGTNNFKLASDGSATNFIPNDQVLFDDSAAGSGTVDVDDALQPAAVTVNNGSKAYTFQGAGSIGGAGGLTKQGAGTLTVLTNNTYVGATTVSGGTLNIGTGGSIGEIGTGPLVNNGTVVWNRAEDVTFAGAISGSGSFTKAGANILTLSGSLTGTGSVALPGGQLVLAAAADYAYDGVITGAGSLAKRGTGAVTLAGNNTYSGGTTIDSGTLQIGAGGLTGTLAGDVSINGISGINGALIFNRAGAYTYAGNISSSGRVVAAGPGNLTLSGVITQNPITRGSIVAQAGTLTLANPNTAGILGPLTATGGATVVLDTATGDQLYGNVVSGQGTLVKASAGTATLTGANTFTGTVLVNAGTLVLSDPNVAGGDLNALSLVVNGGATFQFGQGLAAGGPAGENPDFPDTSYITANPGGTIEWRVGEQIGGINLQGGTLLFNGGGTTSNGATENWTAGTVTTIDATARNAGGGAVINKTTAGTVLVTGAATVNRTINIQDGTFAYAAAANLSGNAITLGTAGAGGTTGTLEYQGATAAKAGNVALTGPGVVRVTQPGAALTLSGVISGSGAFTKDGPGTLVLSGTNTNTGPTTIAAGTLAVAANERIANGSALTIAAGATLDLTNGGTGNFSETVSSLAGAGAVTLGSGTLTSGGAATSTYSGVITGTGSLAKTGAGTLIVTGTHAYTGGTTVTGGTLDASGGSIAASTGPMAVSNAGSAVAAPQVNPSTLTVGAGASVRLTNADGFNSLAGRSTAGTLANTGLIDVGRTGLVVATADPVDVQAQIVAGRGGAGGTATWAGTTGLTSAAAAADVTNRAVGFRVVGPGVTVAYTLLGDANLDGIVNPLDRSAYLANVGGSGKRWDQADFKYDGLVNPLDRAAYLGHVGQSLSAGGTPKAAPARTPADATTAAAAAATPAPAFAPLATGPVTSDVTPGNSIPKLTYNPGTGRLTLDTDGLTTINSMLFDVAQSNVLSAVADPDGAAGVAWSTYYAGGQAWDSSSLSAAGNLTPGVWDLAMLKPGLTAAAFGSQGLFGASGHNNDFGFILSDGNLVSTSVTIGVPEPVGAGLLAAGGLGLLARRRRRQFGR